MGKKRKANEISSGSTRGSRAQSGLGVFFGLPIEFLVQGRSRQQKPLAPAAAATSPSQQAEKKRKAEKISPSPAREQRPESESGSSSSSISGRPASSSQPAGKKPCHRGEPVEQCDPVTGRTIARFDSQGDAARVTGIDKGSISKCIRGELKSAGGFGWRNAGAAAAAGGGAASVKGTTSKKPSSTSSAQPIDKYSRGVPPKPVEQFNRATFGTIARFDSLADAARKTGICRGSISLCINGGKTHAGGFGWREQGAGGAAAVVSKQPSASSSQPTDRKPHGGRPGMSVEQYDLATGVTIAQFGSYADAERATGISQGGISACIRDEHLHKSAGGYGWRTPGSGGAGAAASGNKAISKKPSMSVEQYDLKTGRTIGRFDSHNNAARATGIDQGGISACVRGKVKSVGGYGWREPGMTGEGAGAANDGNRSHQYPSFLRVQIQT